MVEPGRPRKGQEEPWFCMVEPGRPRKGQEDPYFLMVEVARAKLGRAMDLHHNKVEYCTGLYNCQSLLKQERSRCMILYTGFTQWVGLLS